MQRRQLLQLAALSAAPASLLAGRSVFAQSADAIRFGCPVPMSGAFAANGKFADLGMKLAIEQYGSVVLFLNVAALLDVNLLNFFALGSGLMRDESHAKHFRSVLAHFIE